MEEIADVVCEAGIPEFEQLAPPNPQKSLPTDLSSFLYPESFYFQLVTIEGRAQIVRKDHPAPEGQLCPLETAASTLPTFAMGEIQVLQTFRGRHITKVLPSLYRIQGLSVEARGSEAVCEALRPGDRFKVP
ncbi:hypothetical protein WAI453_005536 [Rhynchosporium graminicola]